MAYAALFSGGKDSAYAAHLARKSGLDVGFLVTAVPQNPESYMFHSPNAMLTALHSEALGIPLVRVETAGRKEDELGDLKKALGGLNVDGIIAGAIASTYQMSRLEALCRELSLEFCAPLWHRPEETLLREIVGAGFECIFVSVSALGLGEEWLGRTLDREAIGGLARMHEKHGINVSGEGGEYETLVLDGPGFSKRIRIEAADKSWKNDSGKLVVTRAVLEEKNDCRPKEKK
jgi:diphthine-ammonia ligase